MMIQATELDVPATDSTLNYCYLWTLRCRGGFRRVLAMAWRVVVAALG